MTENSALAFIVMLAAAGVLYRFWRPILGVLLMVLVIVFGFGVYSVAAAMTT